MGFNPFIGTSSRSSGGGGTSDVIRYTIVETTRNNQKAYKLQQTINGNTTFVGDEIYFSADNINFNSSWATNVSDALKYLFKSSQANYHFTTFDELGIDSQNKTMEQILQEVLAKDLPVNTIITGQLYSTAIPIDGIVNTEGKIQITEGIDGQQIYWCSASSIEIEPYEWESIYNQKVGTTDIQNPLVWTPTHYILPTASSDALGGVKVGDTLEIGANGLLNVDKTKLKVIDKIEFTSSTGGALPAIEGATDTYTVYYTDGTSFNYSIINGTKGEKGLDGTNGKDGENGKDGITPLFQTTDTALQVSIDGGKTYQDLLMFSVIKGADGKDGKDGEKGEKGDSGDDGITPQLRVTETAIQVSIDNGSTYQDLIELSALMGKKGDDGVSITGASVNDEGHLILSLSSGATIDSGNVKGADGTSINIKASLSSSSELPSSGQQLGDCYLINGHLWVYTNSQKETAVNGFDDAGSIQGPAGRGITTLTINEDGVLVVTYSDGTSSEIGKVKGEDGLPGEKGDNGEDGFSPSVSVSKTGNVTTIITVDKTGEHSAEIKDGEAGQDGKGVELQATDEYIQWRNIGDTNWNNLVAISTLIGPQGEKGTDGKDGKNIELQISADAIQWRVSGTEEWTDLIQLSALKGEEGNGIESIQFTSSTGGETAGIAGATDTYTITFTNGKTSTFTVYNGNNGDGHTHENKEVLDKLSDHNGILEYDNDAVSKIWHGTKAEYEAIPEKSDDWTYIITDDVDTYDASDATSSFVVAETRENIKTGEKLSLLFGKVAKWFSDLKKVAFSGSYNDLIDKPTIPDASEYLPKSGGEMNGNIDLNTNKCDIIITASPSNLEKPTPVSSGYLQVANTIANATPSLRSFMGSYYNTNNEKKYNLISVRHRNGYDNGNANGMIIYCDLTDEGSLSWNKQLGVGKWQGARVLLDSVNIADYALEKNGTAKAAETLVDSNWKDMTLGSYASSGAVQYRTYGSLISITGNVKLKTDIVAAPIAPQSIATTDIDFSELKNCTGIGHTASGKTAMIQLSYYNGDNIVDAFAASETIPADETIYFSLTGFIN